MVQSLAASAGLLGGAALHGTRVGLAPGEFAGPAVRLAIAAAIYMVLGVGIGALARNQVLAIGITLGYFYFLEHLLMIIPGVRTIYPLLPGGATAALTRDTTLVAPMRRDLP